MENSSEKFHIFIFLLNHCGFTLEPPRRKHSDSASCFILYFHFNNYHVTRIQYIDILYAKLIRLSFFLSHV